MSARSNRPLTVPDWLKQWVWKKGHSPTLTFTQHAHILLQLSSFPSFMFHDLIAGKFHRGTESISSFKRLTVMQMTTNLSHHLFKTFFKISQCINCVLCIIFTRFFSSRTITFCFLTVTFPILNTFHIQSHTKHHQIIRNCLFIYCRGTCHPSAKCYLLTKLIGVLF